MQLSTGFHRMPQVFVPLRANVARYLASEDVLAEAADDLRVAVPRQGPGKGGT
jgi:hypothetical protein